VFVTTGGSDKSKIIRLDIDSGSVVRACQLPQSANVGPLAHGDVSVLYQMGRHSSLYILSQEDLTCVEVYYLGHQPDTVACVPFLLSGNLCILVNGAQNCQAYVLGFKSSGVGAAEAQPPFNVTEKGKVTLAPFRYGRSVIISSDTGDLRMYELVVSMEGDQSTATMQPQVTGAFPAQPGVANYFVADRGDLYLGNRGLTKYRIQKADEEFEIRKTGDTTDLFVGPIFPFEQALVHLRRRFRSSMFTAAAVNPETLEEIWRTDFGAPPLGQPFIVDQRLMAFSEQGDLFELTAQGFETGTVGHLIPGSQVKENLDFDRRLQLSDGSFALVGVNSDRVLACRASGTGESRLSPLQAPANRPGGEAEAFGKHVLCSSLDGQVVRVDPWTGSVIGAPFQPAVNPNQVIRWSRPAVFADQNVFVIGTDGGSVYKVVADGEQSLIRQGELELPGAVVSPLITVGERCVGITRAEGVDKVSIFQVFPDLTESASRPLDALYTGHLTAIGDEVYVTTADGKLNCLNSDLTPKWQADLPARLTDVPQDAGSSIVLTFDNGDIQRLDKATGQVLASVQLGRPLASNPLEYNGHWYVNDPQGVVLVIPPLE
jgi:outer membrane protein assembly factor BamB